MRSPQTFEPVDRAIQLPIGPLFLEGDLTIPAGARSFVLFAHGSGSSRRSPRNRFVAGRLNLAHIGTLLFDLLTADEESADAQTGHLRFDIGLLAERLVGALDWVRQQPDMGEVPLGLFGASTGAAAALVAATQRPDGVQAVVSRGGRPDLAGEALYHVRAATLLIVGSRDHNVLELNREAFARLPTGEKELAIVPGATHLFPEPGALEEVAALAADWFVRHLQPAIASTP